MDVEEELPELSRPEERRFLIELSTHDNVFSSGINVPSPTWRLWSGPSGRRRTLLASPEGGIPLNQQVMEELNAHGRMLRELEQALQS